MEADLAKVPEVKLPDVDALPGGQMAAGEREGALSASGAKIGTALALGTIALGGLVAAEFYVAGGGALKGAGLAASYLSGMTMLVLPCTLPMVMVIVPLVLAREFRKGVAMVGAFGVGVCLTLAAYGAVVAGVGSSLGVTTATRSMWLVGGVAAWVFGCAQLGLINVRIPSIGLSLRGRHMPKSGVGQALMLGVLLGNAGLGCPCPPWYLLLTGVASSGSPTYGAAVGFAQGLGRVTPVFALAVAAMLGLDATRAVMRRRSQVEGASGAILVVLGAGIVVFMALAHAWWEATVVHAGWNHALAYLGGPQISEIDAGGGPLPRGYAWAPVLFSVLVLGPLGLTWIKARRARRHGAVEMPGAVGEHPGVALGGSQ